MAANKEEDSVCVMIIPTSNDCSNYKGKLIVALHFKKVVKYVQFCVQCIDLMNNRMCSSVF